jgi:hypothetical protein
VSHIERAQPHHLSEIYKLSFVLALKLPCIEMLSYNERMIYRQDTYLHCVIMEFVEEMTSWFIGDADQMHIKQGSIGYNSKFEEGTAASS